jgi:hypothetical protein
MKRKLLFAAAGLGLLAVAAVIIRPGRGRAQDQGTAAEPAAQAGQAPAAQTPIDPEMNRDLAVTPAVGPWMICVMSYVGDDAPVCARKLVCELRGPNYNLPAYVFNYATGQREKLRQQIEQQRRFLIEQGADPATKIHVPHMRVNDQCAVLIGGYPDMDTAHRDLGRIHALKCPDGKKVDLNVLMHLVRNNPKEDVRADRPLEAQCKQADCQYANPFKTAHVVHNPTVPQDQLAAEQERADREVLKKLNAGENLSLLNCPKPVTLLLAQYTLPCPLGDRRTGKTFWEKIGLGHQSEREDPAAKPARSLAEGLRKAQIEAYVLHTPNASIVTVGGFDSPQDPRLFETQRMIVAWRQRTPETQVLNLVAQPTAMPVPH